MPQSVAQIELRKAIEEVRTRIVESGDAAATNEITALSEALFAILDVMSDLRQGSPFRLPPIGRGAEKKS